MSAKKENTELPKVEEPVVSYESSKMKTQGIDFTTFNFDEEFAKGLTPEEFKAEMYKRIKAYPWKK